VGLETVEVWLRRSDQAVTWARTVLTRAAIGLVKHRPAASPSYAALERTQHEGPGLRNESPLNTLTVLHRTNPRGLPNVSKPTQDDGVPATRKEQQ